MSLGFLGFWMLLGGCNTGTSASSVPVPRSLETTEITIRMQNLQYIPDRVNVPMNQPVSLTLINEDNEAHDMVLQMPAGPVHLFVGSGRQIATSLFFTNPGDFLFVCTQPGHESAGMVGTFASERETTRGR